MYDDGNGQTYKKEKFQPKPQEPKVFKAMGFFKREVSEVAPKTQNDQNLKNLQVIAFTQEPKRQSKNQFDILSNE